MSNTEERMSKLWHTSITADTGLPLDVIPPDFALASSLPNPKVSEVNFLSDLIDLGDKRRPFSGMKQHVWIS